ncbi:acyltransferase [Inhella sp.]|uniref:acyltransferase family protein n=1 Tax=Inhella sp. TaxID=1921806 RepID=UPI0035AF5E25
MTAPIQRLPGLDALRASALVAGLVLHASLAYLPGAHYFWLVPDGGPQREGLLALSPLFYVIHALRMPVFFALAGFWAWHSLQRKGVGPFVRDRARRIGLPLLLGWPLVMAGLVAALVLASLIQHGPHAPPPPPGPRFTVDDFPLAHLWFLYLLLGCYGGWLLLRALLGRGLQRVAAPLALGLARPGGPLLLALPVALVLYRTPYWIAWFGVPTPDRSLLPGGAALTAYGLSFACGVLLAAHPALLRAWARRWRGHALLCAVGLGVGLFTLGLAPALLPEAQGLRKAVLALAYAGAASFGMAALLGAAQGWRCPPWAAELSQASYWIYLVHLPLVLALQALFKPLALPLGLKFGAVCALALALAWLSDRAWVRASWLGAALNGRRRVPLWRAGTMAP